MTATITSPTPDGVTVRGVVPITAEFDEVITRATLFTYEPDAAGVLGWRSHGQKTVDPPAMSATLDWDSASTWLGAVRPDGTSVRVRLNATSQATGVNVPNAPIRTVVADQGPVAAFTVAQTAGTAVRLSSQSIGSGLAHAWTVDGLPFPDTGPEVRVPLSLGEHTFGLTVTDVNGLTDAADPQVREVVWQGWDENGQHHARAVAGDPSPGVWTDPIIHGEAPWDTLGAVMDESDPRLTVTSLGASYKLKYGDQPQPGGGNRIISSLVPTMAHPDWQGNEVDIVGDRDGLPRFARYRCRFPAENPDSLDHGNTFVEGRSDGDMIFTAIPQGNHWTCYARGNRALGTFPYVKMRWEELLWEWLSSDDPTIGYVRLYKDDVCATVGVPSADGHIDPDGKVFLATKPNATSRLIFAAKFYRSSLWGDLGPWFLDFEKVTIALTKNAALAA